MSELENKILKYIEEGFSANQIASVLNLSHDELASTLLSLKNKGIEFVRKYYSDGNISYANFRNYDGMLRYQSSITRRIITKPEENHLTVLAISDLHLGNSKERIDLLNEAYNYCIKNGIHTIFNCGDLVDGTYNQVPQKISDPYEQIEYLIKNYPFDKNILNFCVGGDHDLSVLNRCGLNALYWINNARQDLIIPSFGNGFIRIKDDLILLNHYLPIQKKQNISSKQSLNLIGHTHRGMKIYYQKNGILNVTVPSLSDIGEINPSMIEITINFKNNIIFGISFKQLEFKNNKLNIVTELTLPITKKQDLVYTDSNIANYDFSSLIESDKVKTL